MTRAFDLVLHGATGFTGRQAAQYIHEHIPSTIRWAISGRSLDKLKTLAATIGLPEHVGLIKADALNTDDMDKLSASARVICTTVGPYARYGQELIAACVRNGTHYLDITGETPFVAEVIERYHQECEERGICIVPFCGFDSVPSDSAVYLAAKMLKGRGEELADATAVFKLKGGLNGGTLASALNLAESGRKRLDDPLLLNPEQYRSESERSESLDLDRALHHPNLGWVAPFVMAPINTRVVRRSNALFHERGIGYGPRFRYREGLSVKGRGRGFLVAYVTRLVDRILTRRLGRMLIRALGPSPGQGPSAQAIETGFFKLKLFGRGDEARDVEVVIQAQGDPGNRTTVTALCESAFCLVERALDSTAVTGGILTPMTAFGDDLIRRLQTRGWRFDVSVSPKSSASS